jgi:hypothetical protein
MMNDYALRPSAASKALLVLGLFLISLITSQAAMALPTSCADIKSATPTALDGTFTIYPNGAQFQVYCKGMSTVTPTEYLSLVNVASGANFSQYTAGGATPGTNVVTSYTRVRLDPSTLKVNIGDQMFSTSTGTLSGPGGATVTSMPFGTAMACIASGNAAGLANIDLTGTPFAVNDTFLTQGAAPAGAAVFSPSKQVVNVTGGGFCGWTVPEGGFNPINAFGTFQLQLRYIGPSFFQVPTLSDWALILLSIGLVLIAFRMFGGLTAARR